jgi:hypothetical protein
MAPRKTGVIRMAWRSIKALVLGLAATCAAAPAGAQTALDITGTAPLVCRATLTGSAAGVGLGQVAAFCNDPAGVDVYLDYPTSLAGATLLVGGAPVSLDASGTVRLAHAAGPLSTTLDLGLAQPPSGAVSVTVRVAPVDAASFAVASASGAEPR